jgi:hypothetical protein
MTVRMTMGGELRACTWNCSHTEAIQTIKHLLPLIIDSEGLEHLSLLLSTREEGEIRPDTRRREAYPGQR